MSRPYTSLDNAFPRHPKNWGLTDAAFRLHVAGICFCNEHLTDGMVPATMVRTLVPRFVPKALRELVAAELWVEKTDASAFEIHDYLEWNRSRMQVEAAREAGRKAARTRWGT